MAIEAVGIIEANGYVPIFDAVDAMIKASQVDVRGTARLGGGLVAVLVTGELAAVEEAIAIGEETARTLSKGDVRSIIFASPSPAITAIAHEPSIIDG